MSPKAYTTAWLAVLALPAFIWVLFTLGPMRAVAFRLAVPEGIYLANLRESDLACRTLRFRRPEALVIGDSHSYAAWDFAALEQGLRLRVGACALGGLYVESLPGLLELALREAPQTRLIVLGLSPRMFWESPTKKEQIDFHRGLFATLQQDPTAFLRRALFGESLPYDAEDSAVARHAARIEALDENAIVTRLDRSMTTLRTLRDWNARLENMRFAKQDASTGEAVCRLARKAGARIWALHIPESPYLEARYSETVWRNYRDSVHALVPCAEKFLVEPARSYGLGNRYYVNRQLKDGHDYAGWMEPTPLKDDLAFDADHLNPVGARLFTRKALDRLGVVTQ